MKKLKKRKGYSEIKLERFTPLFNIDKSTYESWMNQLQQDPIAMLRHFVSEQDLAAILRFETPKEIHDKEFAKSFKREVLGEEEKEEK